MNYSTRILKFDDKTDLYVDVWEPEKEIAPKAVIQISHGMAEHMARYHELAEFFVKNGFVVIGADHYAHGRTAKTPEMVGVVTDYDFMNAIIMDMKYTYDEVTSLYKLPCYLYSHSMGSMATQRYIELYPNDFTKVVLSGTDAPNIKYTFAKILTPLKKGKIRYSKFISNLGTGAFNKKFKNEHPKFGWLTHDETIISKYENDPFCNREFPVNYYHSISEILLISRKKSNRELINKNLKLLLVAGNADPVGRFGKGPKQLAESYRKIGLDVELILYPNMRHECQNEPEIKATLFNDVLKFYNN